MSIKENLDSVKERIRKACERSGRRPEEVTLISVSKTKPLSMLMEAYGNGVRIFGENRVKEMLEKEEEMPADCEFHLIGHLQRNKAKQIVNKTALVHSLESLELAKELSKLSLEKGTVTDVLVEINVGNEESKYGISFDEAQDFIRNAAKEKGIRIRGLMAVAPYTETPEENRVYFRKMRQLSVDIKSQNIDNVYMDFLSMGMTGDFEIAVEEGATHVRVGTGIFGEREYPVK